MLGQGGFGITYRARDGQLNRDVATVLQSKEHVEQLAKVGLEAPAPKTLPQLNSYMQEEMRKWSEVVRVSGAKVN